MMLPIVGSTPSELAIAHSLGFYNHIWGMWIMQAHFLGMYYFVFHAMFRGIPKDFAEAAYIDGASEWRVLFSIMLPMVKNTLFIVMLLSFIGYWNDYQTPLLYIPSHPTVAYGLYLFSRSTDQNLATIPMKLTGCMLMVLPIFVIFMIFHDKMIGNISMGGLKE
jgi:ABC-type glycerol-3-phosphate transport system permease component